ncbi:hypothetical protein EYC80_009131 [Monilinia laxa]|uniref:Uncharacterized protein n=1 Tax=Monilinia laxa TaxID=61186 RepID=A0A5N6K2I8_MONLA|nr:hypothetical protein EYC80_009131 [Monilinia laxa]
MKQRIRLIRYPAEIAIKTTHETCFIYHLSHPSTILKISNHPSPLPQPPAKMSHRQYKEEPGINVVNNEHTSQVTLPISSLPRYHYLFHQKLHTLASVILRYTLVLFPCPSPASKDFLLFSYHYYCAPPVLSEDLIPGTALLHLTLVIKDRPQPFIHLKSRNLHLDATCFSQWSLNF